MAVGRFIAPSQRAPIPVLVATAGEPLPSIAREVVDLQHLEVLCLDFPVRGRSTFGDLKDCRVDDTLRLHHPPLGRCPVPVNNKLSLLYSDPWLRG